MKSKGGNPNGCVLSAEKEKAARGKTTLIDESKQGRMHA